MDVPTWEIIWIRMSITWLGCFICTSLPFLLTSKFETHVVATLCVDMKRAGIPHALLGPPEARVLLCVRGTFELVARNEVED